MHGLLRFRTNDVLLGTSGVGVCVSVVSNSPGFYYYYFFYGMLYRLPAGVPSHYLKRSLTGSLSGIGRSSVRNLLRSTLILFFLTCAGPILLQVPPRFDPAFSGSRLVRVSFSSWEPARTQNSSSSRTSVAINRVKDLPSGLRSSH